MTSTVWPTVKKHVSVAKDKITIDPLYLLLLVEEHHTTIIDELFYKKFWQTKAIFCAENFATFVSLLWSSKKDNAINHPFYEFFLRRIVTMKLVKSFWAQVDKTLTSPSKGIEVVTVHAAASIVKNQEDKPKEVLKILTPNFLKMLGTNASKMRDEDVQEIYTEFYDLLDKQFQALNSEKMLEVIQTFTNSGSLTVEKSSSKKFISNLINSLELEALTETVENLKTSIVSDNDDREKQYAATILQKIITGNKLFASNLKWRIEQLIFLLNLAVFKSSNGKDISTSDDDINSNATNIKNIFFHCLEYKLPKLEDEKTVLIGIADHINEKLSKKDPNKYLQRQLKPNHMDSWNKMYSEATAKVDKKNQKLKTVFQVLMLHMGLQLFNSSDVAENAITELQAVTKRALQKKNSQNEPDWIEVVVDLFLTLLSQESHVLRNVIRHVFPQLCGQMTVTAFHQILSLLDLNSKDNPLEVNGNDDEEDDDMDSDEGSDQEGSDDDSQEEGLNGTEENGDDSDAEMEDLEEDGDETVNDTVRLAIQSALGAAGGDGEDIDVDDIDEEEGAKLDMALADAFKLLKQSRKTKKTKADKIAEKSLLHFRMRALDLVEIYLKNNPQMEICLETLIFFYDLMPIAIKNEKQSPLLPRFDGIFIQLAQLKSFSLETVANVTSKHLADTLTNMLQKTVKEKTNIQQLNHFPRACIFLINCSQILQKLTQGEDEVLRIMLEHVREFFTHRNPTLQLNSFNKILATQWIGNFKMAKFIADEGLKSTVRSLRRTQSFQLLKTFFKNHHLHSQNDKQAVKYSGKVCEHLKVYASELLEVPQPEFLELLQFTLAMRQLKNFTAKEELVATIQKQRAHLQLKPNILSTYKSFCVVMKIPFIANDREEPAKVNGAAPKSNGTNGDVPHKQENGSLKRKKNNNMKEKKLKKQKRLAAASKGFNESFTFASSREVMLE